MTAADVKRTQTSAAEHVEKGLAKIFVHSEEARRRRDRHVAGMGFRKTLDIALKQFDATLKSDLYNRIDILAERHDITQAMKLWAHQVRMIGNEAAHEADVPSADDVDAMAAFIETLLKYLFTLPAEVKARASPKTTNQSLAGLLWPPGLFRSRRRFLVIFSLIQL